LLKKGIAFLVNSNCYIAAGATALVIETQWLTGATVGPGALLALVFCATVFIYLLQRFIALEPEQRLEGPGMKAWLSRHRPLVWWLLALSLAGSTVSFFGLSRPAQGCLLLFGVLTLGYSLPMVKLQGKRLRFRDFGLGKTVFVALIWAGITVALPIANAPALSFREPDVIVLLLERFLFILAITIPFDVRDMRFDRALISTPTLPLLLGVRAAKWIALAMLAAFLGLCYWHYAHQQATPFAMPVFYAFLSSGLLTAVLIAGVRTSRSEFYYTLALDGTILLQAGCVGLAVWESWGMQ